ncbi:Pyridine nucleotide-disulfide oxidoreductase family protein [Aspergillus niger]|uniref:Pyridine nucleotide-disulfide oxidoreductase family protein n=1 Tax=Aspergillus niger TaxID=5061 RepID=A0A505IHR1_ASPNG|nr:Pyridine nucleotide-disulfide oxidoreductase family protein [Aspergillus niger]
MLHEREKSPTPLPANLREISSLASWTVSTHKPGCGVTALRHPSPTQYWQSDGPQPHTLTLHFFKLVAIVRIRVYLDFEMDESYTPTKMTFLAGMGGNDLVEFANWEAMVIQMRIIENHQNGKDTHVRGFQVFARDDERKRVGNAPSASADGRVRRHSARRSLRASTQEDLERDGVSKVVTSLEEPDWMGEPVIR